MCSVHTLLSFESVSHWTLKYIESSTEKFTERMQTICSMPIANFKWIVCNETMHPKKKTIRSDAKEEYYQRTFSLIGYGTQWAQNTMYTDVFRRLYFFCCGVFICMRIGSNVGTWNKNIPHLTDLNVCVRVCGVVDFNVCQAANARNHKNMLIRTFFSLHQPPTLNW